MQRILKSTMELTFQFEAEKHKIIIQNFNGKKENVVYTEQSLGEALLTRGLIKKKDEEILQDCLRDAVWENLEERRRRMR